MSEEKRSYIAASAGNTPLVIEGGTANERQCETCIDGRETYNPSVNVWPEDVGALVGDGVADALVDVAVGFVGVVDATFVDVGIATLVDVGVATLVDVGVWMTLVEEGARDDVTSSSSSSHSSQSSSSSSSVEGAAVGAATAVELGTSSSSSSQSSYSSSSSSGVVTVDVGSAALAEEAADGEGTH